MSNGPKITVRMPRTPLIDVAMFGQEDRVESFFRTIVPAAKRLGVKPTKAFAKKPRGPSAVPNLHDVMRWLDSLTANDADELHFLGRLYATLRSRAKLELIKELKA